MMYNQSVQGIAKGRAIFEKFRIIEYLSSLGNSEDTLATLDFYVILKDSMKSFEDLIQDLKSTDPAIRDEAALDLMDIGNDEAVSHLVEAIRAPGNKNYRGTLVYSLSGYNCGEYLEYLVELCLKANFEVSSNAFNIIEELAPNNTTASRIKAYLAEYDSDKLPYEHSVEAYKSLSDIVSNNLV